MSEHNRIHWDRGITVRARLADIPLIRHRRLYAIMLQPWFPWRLRKWIESNVLSRISPQSKPE